MPILHCEVRNDNQTLEPGHWFFDEGNWAVCAEAGKTDAGKWNLFIRIDVAGKAPCTSPMQFTTLREAKSYLGEYFNTSVVRVRASQMPKPDEL
jgi:hypothetical protein